MTNKKYVFCDDETKDFYGITLHRIKRVRDGEKGGWIEKESCLSQDGDAWVYGNAQVYGDARVYGDAQVSGNALVYGDARVYGNAWVYGDARVYGDAQVSGNAWVYGDALVSNRQDLVHLSGLRYNITATPQNLSIGCQLKTWREWKKVTYKDVASELTKAEFDQIKRFVRQMPWWPKP